MSFLLYLELKRKILLYTPVVHMKTIPDSGPKWVKSIPVFRPKQRKNYILLVGTYLIIRIIDKKVHLGVRAWGEVYWINFYVQALSSFLCSHSALRDGGGCNLAGCFEAYLNEHD